MATTMAQVKRETLKSIGNVPDLMLKRSKETIKQKDGLKTVAPTTPSTPSSTSRAPTHTRVSTTTKHKVPKVLPSASASTASTAAVPAAVTALASPVVHPAPCIKPTTNATVVAPQLLLKEPVDCVQTHPASGDTARRIYSREFLIKFKNSATPFPPSVPTPADLIAQYNKEFEIKERLALENSSFKPIIAANPSSILSIPHQPMLNGSTKPILKKVRREGEDGLAEKNKNTFKLRLANTDESILRCPLFRAAKPISSTSTRHVTPPSITSIPTTSSINTNNIIKGDDKENPVPVKSARSVSATKRKESVKTMKPSAIPVPSTTALTHIQDPFSVPISVAPTTEAALVVPSAALAVATVTDKPSDDCVMTDEAKQDPMDILAKKLKTALKETDPRRLAQRQKQIEYGKATLGYKDFVKQVAKSKRKREDPKTPNKYQVCSKRSWDGQIRKWRRMLHFYDPADLANAEGSKDVNMNMDEDVKTFEITEADLLAEQKALMD